MSKQPADYLIVGAGIAGLATAFYLNEKKAGRILIVDKEKTPGRGATGQNAGMLCQLVRDPLLCEFMMDGAHQLKTQWLPRFKSNVFHECGSFHIGSEKDMVLFEQVHQLAHRRKLKTFWFNRTKTVYKQPILTRSVFDKALYCPSDGIIDRDSFIQYLHQDLQDKGIEFIFLKNALEIPEMGKVIVNASGAWSNEISNALCAQPLKLTPKRRHVYVTENLFHRKTSWPIVWDASHEIYFRPYGKKLMFSPCDETDYPAGPVQTDNETETMLRRKMKSFVPEFVHTTFESSWAGLRTFSEDRRFVIGQDSELNRLYWVAGLGGYGLTAGAAVGKFAADLILGQKVNSDWEKALSPKRFKQCTIPANDVIPA